VAAPLSVLPSGLPAYPDPPAALARLQGLPRWTARLLLAPRGRSVRPGRCTAERPGARGVPATPEPGTRAHRRGWGSLGSSSPAFGSRLRQLGIRASMGSVGDCYDHALIQSFFATLECELIDRPLAHQGGGPSGGLLVAGGDLQPDQAALLAWLPEPDGV
jgi:transposase InsO family protein